MRTTADLRLTTLQCEKKTKVEGAKQDRQQVFNTRIEDLSSGIRFWVEGFWKFRFLELGLLSSETQFIKRTSRVHSLFLGCSSPNP